MRKILKQSMGTDQIEKVNVDEEHDDETSAAWLPYETPSVS